MAVHHSAENTLWRTGRDWGTIFLSANIFHNCIPNKHILQDEGESMQSSKEEELKI